ncbi:hypothetical protein AYO21_12137 [Fonsecaea monophora]|uniref:Uncharacterized protein n=1 Tax=Fonsecaea monophora TaxID=254056 RepID=A0A177EPB8_9EURO|nr:hypothetical protein AYO21_12137 [Fonsecaea monophora]KAH0837596.1 hypothetical protein FOPE_05244 [Fonsecaea pedrosoi]OAG33777.1 hypothetical protein AYO21_12137 [Fonsecaea monophora]
MAYLLIAAGVHLRQKLHERKELQREKKRMEYEQRYRDLEQDHAARVSNSHQTARVGVDSVRVARRHDEPSVVLDGNKHERNSMEDGERRRSEDNSAGCFDKVVNQTAQMKIS